FRLQSTSFVEWSSVFVSNFSSILLRIGTTHSHRSMTAHARTSWNTRALRVGPLPGVGITPAEAGQLSPSTQGTHGSPTSGKGSPEIQEIATTLPQSHENKSFHGDDETDECVL